MAKKHHDALVLFPDIMTGTRDFTDSQFGSLMRAIFRYRFEGTETELDDPMVSVAFGFIKSQLERYNEICEINRINRSKRTTKAKESNHADHQLP